MWNFNFIGKMEGYSETIYVFSNGAITHYPENNLTNFSNNFPRTLFVNNKYEIGIQALGFSSKFRNVVLPPKNMPSLIISNCNAKEDYYSNKSLTHNFVDEPEGPMKWTFNEHKIKACVNERHFFPDPTTGEDIGILLPSKCTVQACFYEHFNLKDINYTDEDIANFCTDVSAKTGIVAQYDKKRITFSIHPNWVKQRDTTRCYLIMHESFMSSFGFQVKAISSYVGFNEALQIHGLIRLMQVGSTTNVEHFVRTTRYKGERYVVFYIQHIPRDNNRRLEEKISLVSKTIDLNQPKWPKTIKWQCDQIQPQIYNNTLAQNMLVYTPDFNSLGSYTTQEIESVLFAPLANTALKKLTFKLVDEKNKPIQLLPGEATWIKLILRQFTMNRESFNIVMTSDVSPRFPENVQSKFSIQLPQQYTLDDTWRVCLSSISHPSKFSTFLPSENKGEELQMLTERSIIFDNSLSPKKYLTFKDDYGYDADEILFAINDFMVTNNIGECQQTKTEVLGFTFNRPCDMYLSESLMNILGHIGSLENEKINGVKVCKIAACETSCMVIFKNKIDVTYLYPKYLMVYANFIKPKIVGGVYRKLLRIAPISQSELDYTTTHFRNKEYCGLESQILNELEIIIASHDGRRICFQSPQNVVVNLELSSQL